MKLARIGPGPVFDQQNKDKLFTTAVDCNFWVVNEVFQVLNQQVDSYHSLPPGASCSIELKFSNFIRFFYLTYCS